MQSTRVLLRSAQLPFRFTIQSLLDISALAATPSSSSSPPSLSALPSSSGTNADIGKSDSHKNNNEHRIQVGRHLLECVSHRLEAQHSRLEVWMEHLERDDDGDDGDNGDNHDTISNIHKESTNTNSDFSSSSSSASASIASRVIRTANYHTPMWKQTEPTIPTKQSSKVGISHKNNSKNSKNNNEAWRKQGLPSARRKMETLQWIHKDTLQSCHDILQLPITHSNLAYHLKHTLTQVQARHARTVETLAELVVQDLRPYHRLGDNNNNKNSGTAMMERYIFPFLQHRLGIQLLCEHYMEIAKQKPHGTIDYQRSIQSALLDAMGESNILTQAYYDVIPELIIADDDDSDSNGSSELTATFVGPWLHYILVELLKNATTATVQRHDQASNTNNLPPIVLSAWLDKKDQSYVWIAIDDEGVGINQEMGKSCKADSAIIKEFGFAQTNKIWDRLEEQTTYAMVRSPLQGLGVGLSLSSVMARYFGGTLILQSRPDGIPGTRALVGIPTNLDILEPNPQFV